MIKFKVVETAEAEQDSVTELRLGVDDQDRPALFARNPQAQCEEVKIAVVTRDGQLCLEEPGSTVLESLGFTCVNGHVRAF